MIQLNVEQHLGHKALLLSIGKRAGVAFILFIVAVVMAMAKNFFIASSGAIVKGAGGGAATVSNLATTLSYISDGLFIIVILVFIVGYAISLIEYRNYSFTFEEFDLRMKHGVITRAEISIPYRQIQDVNIHEENNEKEMAEVILEPIEHEFAEEIRNLLERKIGVQVVKDEKSADEEAGEAVSPNMKGNPVSTPAPVTEDTSFKEDDSKI